MATAAVTPQPTEWDAQGNPIQASSQASAAPTAPASSATPAASGPTEWDAQGNPIAQGSVTNSAGETMPADVAARHALTRAGKDNQPADLGRYQGFSDIGEGFAKGAGDTAGGMGQIASSALRKMGLHSAADVLSNQHGTGVFDAGDTTAENAAQMTGKVGENILEFVTGDEALKGLAVADRLKLATKLNELAQSSPRIAKALDIGLRAVRPGVVGGIQGTVKSGGDIGTGLETGLATGAGGVALEAAGEGLSALGTKAEGTPGWLKQAYKGEKVAQEPAKAALSGTVENATPNMRAMMDRPIAEAATKERGLYDKLNEAAKTDMKDLYERREEIQDAIDDPTNIAQKSKLNIELKRTNMQIANGEDNVAAATGKDAKQLLEEAKNSTKQRFALQEVKKNIYNNESVVSGNAEHGAEESVNVDAAIKAAEKMNKPSRYAPEGSATRLQQALGKDGARELLQGLYDARKAGQSALSKQKLAKLIGYVIAGTGVATKTVEGISKAVSP